MTGQRMAAEMAEQPAVLARLAARSPDIIAELSPSIPRPLAGVVLIGRGSSDNACVYGRYLAESASGRPAGLAAPSLHTATSSVDYSGYLAVALSQSGMTPEIITTCERMRKAGATTVAITNDPTSALAGAVDRVVALDAGPETAVPATKTVTAELLAIAILCTALGRVGFRSDDLEAVSTAVARVLDDPDPAAALAQRWGDADRALVVSRGLMYGGCLEIALKLKECAHMFAQGISAADLAHGPIVSASPEVMALLVQWDRGGDADLTRTAGLLSERGAPVSLCSIAGGADLVLPADLAEPLAIIPAVVRGQQLALALARQRGLDADRPVGQRKITLTH